MQRAGHATEQALRLQFVFPSGEGQQVMQVQRLSGPLHDGAIVAARRQISVAASRVSHDLIQEKVDARDGRATGAAVGPRSGDGRAGHVSAHSIIQDAAECRADCGDRQEIAHRCPPLRERR